MSRVIRRSLFVAVVALIALPFTAVGSSAQQADDLTWTVRKVVVGTGTGPSSVLLNCTPVEGASAQYAAVLNFDAQGNPTTSDDEDFEIVDGAWTNGIVNVNTQQCDFTETDAGGATSTSWTCAYESEPLTTVAPAQVQEAGCEAESGSGTGPVNVVFPSDNEVASQASTVTFTNTFAGPTPSQPATQPAAAVVASPGFTG